MDRREKEALDRYLTTEPDWRTDEEREAVMKIRVTTSKVVELEQGSSWPETILEHVATMLGRYPISQIAVTHEAGTKDEEEVVEIYEPIK